MTRNYRQNQKLFYATLKQMKKNILKILQIEY